jgi:excisionase family DNA binding protein
MSRRKQQHDLRESLRFVSSTVACDILGVTSQTLRKWARNGQIGAIRTPGGFYRFDLSGLIVAATPAVQPQPKPHKRAKAPRKLQEAVQPQTAPTSLPTAETAPAASPEPFAAMLAHVAPGEVKLRPSPETLKAQIEQLALASSW